jgi:hypothetical protein
MGTENAKIKNAEIFASIFVGKTQKFMAAEITRYTVVITRLI